MKILPNAGFNKLTGFVQNVDFGNPALIARLKKFILKLYVLASLESGL
ncbi:MAG: hypothetical protein ACLSA2_09420 [Candidatus Gastranaerophilaceae bacterium]